MHAHKCDECAKGGKEVIWYHPHYCRGIVEAHKCPECGTVNWKQCEVRTAALPKVARQHTHSDLANQISSWLSVAAGILVVAYIAVVLYDYISASKKPAA